MPYAPFHQYFPELAKRETRSVAIFERELDGLPRGQYGLLELYCDEPGCDCRRVMFIVVTPQGRDPLAVIAYGWETRAYYARWMGDDDPRIVRELKGPVLNLGSPQSRLGPAILDLVKNVVLADEAYVERLKTHYRLFRQEIEKRALEQRRAERKKRRKRVR